MSDVVRSIGTKPYEQMGGDAGIRRLVDRFYDLINTAPEAATIRGLHAASPKASREKRYMYLTGWTGGPIRQNLHNLADQMRNQPSSS